MLLSLAVWIPIVAGVQGNRSEEHTSELQSRSDLVCRLLLEKKKKKVSNIFIAQQQAISRQPASTHSRHNTKTTTLPAGLFPLIRIAQTVRVSSIVGPRGVVN